MQTATYIWAKIIGLLEQQFSAVAVSAMLDDAEVLEINDRALVIYSPTDFRQETIRRIYKAPVEEILRNEFNLQISFEVWGDAQRNAKSSCTTWNYNPHYDFDSFVVGASNQVPLKAAMQVAENLGNTVYNPLYLYGPPGVGKTHLLYAIANRISQLKPDAHIVCIKADQFTSELIQAIMNGKTAAFKEKYRTADILLVDDIQFIAGKDATQEEFFHTFNYLYEAGKQIVLTSDRVPGDMATLEDRLKGRFGAGVMVRIAPPDRDTRVEIIKSKATTLGLKLSCNIMEYLADKLSSNVRQIEGGLRKILAFRDLTDMEMTLDNIARTVADITTDEATATVTPDMVLRYVCRYYGVEQVQLQGRQRSKNIAEPRQVAMYLIRTMAGRSQDEIGKIFGRDRTTVSYALSAMENILCIPGNEMEPKLQDIKQNIESNS